MPRSKPGRKKRCALQLAAITALKAKSDDSDVAKKLERLVNKDAIWPPLEAAVSSARNKWSQQSPLSRGEQAQRKHALKSLESDVFASRFIAECVRLLREYKAVKILPGAAHKKLYSNIEKQAAFISETLKTDANFAITTLWGFSAKLGVIDIDTDLSSYHTLMMESIVEAARRMRAEGSLSLKPKRNDAALGYFSMGLVD